MSTPPSPPAFRAALREELVRRVLADTDPRPRSPWWRRSRRTWLGAGAVVAVGLASGSVAVATGALPLPGADQVTLRAAPVTTIHRGSATVDLGRRPADSTNIELTLTCLTAGVFAFADGADLSCDPEDAGTAQKRATVTYTLPLRPGQTSTTITTSPDARWSLVTTYSNRTVTAWAVNAAGQTYGVANSHGTPDLVAVEATNGRDGYSYATELDPPQPHFTSPADAVAWQKKHQGRSRTIPVFTSDGHTVIGEFRIGP